MQNKFNLNYLHNMILDKDRIAMYITIATKAIKYELNHVLINLMTHN